MELIDCEDPWLIGCEESQAVTIELRKRGINAFSCDLEDCSGGYPEWHLKMDIFEALKLANWKVLIAFPPCTYLTVAANRHMVSNPDRWEKMVEALKFVYSLMNVDIEHIAIENPVGAISTYIRKPDQIINPYYFFDNVPKRTCLWLKNLPKLVHIPQDDLFAKKTHVEPEHIIYNSNNNKSGKKRYSVHGKLGKGKGKERSKTFPGIAVAMAEQWCEYINQFSYEKTK